MCSIGEDDFGDEGGLHAMTPPDETTTEKALECACKCGRKNAVYVVVSRKPECRDCFLKYVRHKFRATLGSSKVLPRDAEVLLVFDDSDESLVLLDMLHYSQTQNNFKRLHCTVHILFIDDNALLYPINGADYQRHLSRVREYLARYNHFDTLICTSNLTEIRIYNLKDDVTLIEDRILHPFVETIPMLNPVHTIRTLTSRQDYLKCQRNQVIAYAAKFVNIEHVLVATTSTKLAADFIAAIALGRGGSAALDVSLVDDRLGSGFKLIRPLKDLTEAEVLLYICAQQLKPFKKETTLEDDATLSSVQNVVSQFVTDLQKNFPATVPTIYRTGSKIEPNRELAERFADLKTIGETKLTTCSFCNSKFEYTETLLAIEFSRLVSGPGNTLDNLKDLDFETLYSRARSKRHGNDEEEECKYDNKVGYEAEQPKILCHACRNIQSDCNDNKNLTDQVKSSFV